MSAKIDYELVYAYYSRFPEFKDGFQKYCDQVVRRRRRVYSHKRLLAAYCKRLGIRLRNTLFDGFGGICSRAMLQPDSSFRYRLEQEAKNIKSEQIS